jgi:ABC-2 type transport system ATP-binding protein
LENTIEIKELTKQFDENTAVDHITLQVWKGEIFGFLGPNGAGKTTTIRMLVGLVTPTEGTATIQGYDIQKEAVKVKQCIGVVPETSNLYNELTVWENLQFMARLYHVQKNKRESRIRNLLKTFGLADKSEAKFGGLSKGLKRRLTIAAALIHNPKIIFLDEPTSGLDVMSTRSLRQFLKNLRATGVTIFLTTHYIEEANQLCDRIAIIVKGRIVAIDSPEQLKAIVKGRLIIEVLFTSPVESINFKELETYGQIKVKHNTLRIQVTEVSKPLKALTHFLEDRDLDIVHLNIIKPSLEDAFVQLTGVKSEAMLIEKNQRGGQA